MPWDGNRFRERQRFREPSHNDVIGNALTTASEIFVVPITSESEPPPSTLDLLEPKKFWLSKTDSASTPDLRINGFLPGVGQAVRQVGQVRRVAKHFAIEM